MSKSVKQLLKEYEELYGHIPDDNEGQLQYLREKYGVCPEKYDIDLTEPEWLNCHVDLPLVPMPAKRPRSSADGHFYVEGAATHRKIVQGMIDYHGIVYTTCIVDIDVYLPIPYSSLSKREIYKAHLGLLRPLPGDWDNFAKTYCDCIQNLLITNDNIIVGGRCDKWYSVKPHTVIDISYNPQFDSKYNERKIIHSKSYERNIERVKMNEYTSVAV